MDTDLNTEHDSATPPTPEEAKVVDTAVENDKPVEVSDDEAIISALRGEEPPKEEATKEEPKTETKAEGEAKPTEEAKSVLDTETSDDMKGRTKERFNAVLEEGKRYREEATQLRQQYEESKPIAEWGGQVMRMLGESGGTAEDLAMSIGVIQAVVGNNTANKERALEEVEKIRVTLATQLGRPINGVSHLAEFPELQKMVDEGEISASVAEELASKRKGEAVRKQRESEDATRQREKFETDQVEAKWNQELQQANAQIDALANRFSKEHGKDEFDTRVNYAMAQSRLLKEMGTSVEPSKLAGLFEKLYKSPEADALVQAKSLASARVTPGAKPLMGAGRGGTGGASREPSSVEDAILAGLRGQ